MEAGSGKGGDVAEKIEATNPVLEAFGNAKTRNNDNSSRFGKYLKVFLDDDGTVTGAKAEHYLLETVRVVKKNDQERNYHIFYMMLAPPGDAPPADEEDEADEEPIPDPGPVVFSAEPFRLEQDAQKYTYLKHDPALTTDRKDPADFRKLRKAFRRLNFAEDDEMAIYKILAGILHCGNMEFEGGDKATIKRTDALGHAAACFGVTAEQLSAGICKKTGMDNGTKVQYDRSVSVAQAARDTMCKYLYVTPNFHVPRHVRRTPY
jgi:myosin heavy subunit